jgi:hypothetical protein
MFKSEPKFGREVFGLWPLRLPFFSFFFSDAKFKPAAKHAPTQPRTCLFFLCVFRRTPRGLEKKKGGGGGVQLEVGRGRGGGAPANSAVRRSRCIIETGPLLKSIPDFFLMRLF